MPTADAVQVVHFNVKFVGSGDCESEQGSVPFLRISSPALDECCYFGEESFSTPCSFRKILQHVSAEEE